MPFRWLREIEAIPPEEFLSGRIAYSFSDWQRDYLISAFKHCISELEQWNSENRHTIHAQHTRLFLQQLKKEEPW